MPPKEDAPALETAPHIKKSAGYSQTLPHEPRIPGRLVELTYALFTKRMFLPDVNIMQNSTQPSRKMKIQRERVAKQKQLQPPL